MAMRCLTGLPILMAMFATTLLDIASYRKIKSRNVQNHQNSGFNQPIINNIIGSHIINNSPRIKCLETSIRSTTISLLFFIILISIFIIGVICGMFPFHVVALGMIIINSLRVPLIVSLALNKNQTNGLKSRTDRQEWEMKHAMEERQRRSTSNNSNNI